MRSTSAVAASEWLAKRRALPKTITLHNASELTSKALDERAEVNGVTLNLMRPGKAIENGVLASFNGRLGDECLTHQEFKTLARTMQLVGACRAAPPRAARLWTRHCLQQWFAVEPDDVRGARAARCNAR
jgi:transposase InsO family protein